MSEQAPRMCATCQASEGLIPVAELAEQSPVRIAKPAPPKIPASAIGCLPVMIVTLVAILSAILIGGLVQLTAQPLSSASGDLRTGDTGTFTGIVVFMVVFVALFGALVWRQTRNDRIFKSNMVLWRDATDRYDTLIYCSNCQHLSVPGTGRSVPADQAERLIYQ
jgi:hypothetical protein